MKTTKTILTTSVLLSCSLLVLTSCAGERTASGNGRQMEGTSSGGGIDPITMAGIEQSNRNTDEAAQAQSQAAIDQINRDTQATANPPQ